MTIKQIERAIVERAWDEGWIVAAARAPAATGRSVGVSAPARPAWRPRSSSRAPATP